MLYAKRRLCVLWDFKERTLNALAFAGAQDIVSDTGCQCEQRRQHCREPDIEEDRLRPGAGEPGVDVYKRQWCERSVGEIIAYLLLD